MLHFSNHPYIDQHSASSESDVAPATQKLMFSSSMSDEDFFKWLRSKGISDKDCKTLPGKYTILSATYILLNREYCHRVMVCIDLL